MEKTAMASITIRNLEDDIKQRLRVRAAPHANVRRASRRASADAVKGRTAATVETD